MAENENTLTALCRNGERAKMRRATFDLTITLDALTLGIEATKTSPPAQGIKDELTVLYKFAGEARKSVDKMVKLLTE